MLGINTKRAISLIASILLLQFISIIQSSQPCPTNCTCSLLENSLSSATCNQFPYLAEFNDDLHVLKIASTEICPISKYLPKFTKLNTLSVSDCAIDVDSNSFKNLSQLQTVTLVNASITNFDPSLFEFNQNLKIVNLSSNPLKIWRHFLVSASVEVVDLSNCGLSEIPKKAFSQILNLKRLILRGNWLKTFNVILPNSINFLDLSDNRFEDVSLRALKPLVNLNEIDLSNNPLVCSCKLKLIEKYLSFKNVLISKSIDCVTQTKEIIPLNQLSLRDVCKLRDTLDENVFVAKLLQRLRRSVSTTIDSFEKFPSIDSQNATFDNSTPKAAYVLEAGMNFNGGADNAPNAEPKMDFGGPDRKDMDKNGAPDAGQEQTGDFVDPDRMIMDGNFVPDGGPGQVGPGQVDPGHLENGVASTTADYVNSGTGDGSNEGSGLFTLKAVIILLAFIITLLLLLVIAIVTAIILKMLKENSDDDCCAAAACANACQESRDNEGGCQMPMLSRRCSTRKGTCRICPSTLASRRSRRSCKCSNRGDEISDVETVACNESQFDCSNMTSACTTFERPNRRC